jgi:hypothetical protein
MFLIIDLSIDVKKTAEWGEFKLSVTREVDDYIRGILKSGNIKWEFQFNFI